MANVAGKRKCRAVPPPWGILFFGAAGGAGGNALHGLYRAALLLQWQGRQRGRIFYILFPVGGIAAGAVKVRLSMGLWNNSEAVMPQKPIDNLSAIQKRRRKDMDKIMENLNKEEKKLSELEEKVRAQKAKVEKLRTMVQKKRFSEADHVLEATGLSLEAVMAAIKNGDLLSLQEKIEKKSEEKGGEMENIDTP